ncbi:MAG: hypothetical protein RSA66_09990 [Muribaculaceae bacterium]
MTEFDEQLREINTDGDDVEVHNDFVRRPQMLPFIGEKYTSQHKKLLIIGESHYLPDEADDELRTTQWYYTSDSEMDEKTLDWINTRSKCICEKWEKGHSIYRNANKVMQGVGNEEANMFKYVAYYNYFQRPAYPKGEGFQSVCEPMDIDVAKDVFCGIIGIIKPDCIAVLSKYAWENIQRIESLPLKIQIDFFPHPASSWWNRPNYLYKNKILTGKEKFRAFLVDNEAFK